MSSIVTILGYGYKLNLGKFAEIHSIEIDDCEEINSILLSQGIYPHYNRKKPRDGPFVVTIKKKTIRHKSNKTKLSRLSDKIELSNFSNNESEEGISDIPIVEFKRKKSKPIPDITLSYSEYLRLTELAKLFNISEEPSLLMYSYRYYPTELLLSMQENNITVSLIDEDSSSEDDSSSHKDSSKKHKDPSKKHKDSSKKHKNLSSSKSHSSSHKHSSCSSHKDLERKSHRKDKSKH
jgi:hypothetical protein